MKVKNILSKVILANLVLLNIAMPCATTFAQEMEISEEQQTEEIIKEIEDDITLQDIQEYYSHSVFIGDSVMVGYQYFAQRTPTATTNRAYFLAAVSFSAIHALIPVSRDSLQPEYLGVKRNVWDSILLMGDNVQRVFILLGTNDLVMRDPEKTANNILAVACKIKEVRPDVEIHFVSMTPVYNTGKSNGCLNRAGIDMLNSNLQVIASTTGYGYVDLNSNLRDAQGNLIPAYCSDAYVHHTNRAYSEAWESVFYNYAYNKLSTKMEITADTIQTCSIIEMPE